MTKKSKSKVKAKYGSKFGSKYNDEPELEIEVDMDTIEVAEHIDQVRNKLNESNLARIRKFAQDEVKIKESITWVQVQEYLQEKFLFDHLKSEIEPWLTSELDRVFEGDLGFTKGIKEKMTPRLVDWLSKFSYCVTRKGYNFVKPEVTGDECNVIFEWDGIEEESMGFLSLEFNIIYDTIVMDVFNLVCGFGLNLTYSDKDLQDIVDDYLIFLEPYPKSKATETKLKEARDEYVEKQVL